jgi:hypothetical protein
VVTTGSPLTTTTMATTTSAVPEFQAERRRPVCSAEVKAFLHTGLFPIFIFFRILLSEHDSFYFQNISLFYVDYMSFFLSLTS